MKNKIFSMLCFGATAAASLSLPLTVGAQSPSSGALDKNSPQILVTIDAVTTSPKIYNKLEKQTALGEKHNALLLAALLKSGAQHTQAMQITTTADVPARLDFASQTIPTLNSFVHVKPSINKNGTITVTMTDHWETLSSKMASGSYTPSVGATEITVTRTFQSGETQLIGGCVVANAVAKNNHSEVVIFANVVSTSNAQPTQQTP